MLKIKKNIQFLLLNIPLIITASISFNTICQSSVSSNNCNTCGPTSKNLWQPHAFSNYASREILIMKGLDLARKSDSWLNRVGFATEYMNSFDNGNDHGLGAMPFWSGTSTMTIGNNDGKADLDAYQFGMGDVDVDSAGVGGKITFAPNIQQVGSEFLWYGMQNKDKYGVYAKFKVPLGAMIVTSNVCEDPAKEKLDIISGYHAPKHYYPTLTAALHSGTYQKKPVYYYGKLAGCKQTQIRLGDITMALGMNAIAKEDKLLGFGAKISCPTGNVPQAEYMIEPIFGRAGHWGVGAELFGEYTYNFDSTDCQKERSIRLWAQGELMHLFNGRTGWRSFDLAANGKGSKYILIQKYNFKAQAPYDIYQIGLDAAINYTTLPVVSSFGMEGNFSLAIDFKQDNWNMSVIGEFWGRSKENLSIHCYPIDFLNNQVDDFDLNNYAVMGRQMAKNPTPGAMWCQPNAKINESQPAVIGKNLPIPGSGVVDASVSTNRIPSDYNKALDICGAQAQKIMTGKFLAEFGYTWKQHNNVPNVSIFGGAELAGKNSNWPRLWSIGLQASMQF